MVKRLWGNNDCDKYILPIHTMWIPRESCEENKRFKCQSGYIPEVQTKCKNGAWYLEPTCQDCDKYILPIHTMWIPRESCEENKRFKCQSGYIPEVQTICKNGAWYLEPTCRGKNQYLYRFCTL
ncbi:hypothetical protein LOTGIDRAFT_170514 [Lottia gigantea]|uniref:Sushi domain-containing protein n=1 Tax=Lottia gigantea TaxID=225164 RepID=V4BAW3_LOTGI|nr:hypothetical protein LOTGIDRAFT_170514 [Lottia gigantea]ESP04676.1 hypothetical protein LOTGIDRAFT_170514 [Lottia gigantea]